MPVPPEQCHREDLAV